MAQVEFDYNGIKTIIQCNVEDQMEQIIQKFLIKCNKNSFNNLFFLYDGKILDIKLSFQESANEIDKGRKQMNIIVNEGIQENNEISTMIKSKFVICPECKESISISIKDYKIFLENCKNGHKIKNIFFTEFEKTQLIDQSEIKCDECQKANKSTTFENKFFICCTCDKSLCPLCQNIHNKEHHLIDYEEKNFICKKHYESYISYCKNCKSDICVSCLKEHHEHNIINYGDILPDIKVLEEELNQFKKIMMDYKDYINGIISKLKELLVNLDNYYNIYDNIIKNFNNKKRNYNTIINLNYINNYSDDLMFALKEIINKKDIKNKLNDIMIMYSKMTFKEKENDNYTEDDNVKKEAIENHRNKRNITIYPGDWVSEVFQLNDERILVVKYNDKKDFYKLCVFNINNDFAVCDISFDVNYSEFKSVIQMGDNNLILLEYKKLKVIKINKHIFEITQIIEISDIYENKIIKMSKEKICLYRENFFKFYLYKNGILIDEKQEINFNIKNKKIKGCCPINENEIALLCDERNFLVIFFTHFLMFYDIKNKKEIKTLKLGSFEFFNNGSCCLVNENYLVTSKNDVLQIIDTKTRKIIKEIKCGINDGEVLKLNGNIFCYCNRFMRQLSIFKFENIDKIKEFVKNAYYDFNVTNWIICKEKLIIIKKNKEIEIYKHYNDLLHLNDK